MFRGASFYTCEWAQASNCSLSILVAFSPSYTISELTYALIVPIPTYIECTLCIIIMNIQLSPSKDKTYALAAGKMATTADSGMLYVGILLISIANCLYVYVTILHSCLVCLLFPVQFCAAILERHNLLHCTMYSMTLAM